ncbi:glycine--tRNA ligase subunit beta [Thiohalophilus sp.]|uniref:glycine--tRNA ligase subunit beta n=1 Tax=Thiohalophilus sp. TaxID=3028392 RepID=UPI002ACD62E1|nr:glycine--tRNA ligase subunit beta [Thiohalophilus sp.]MDZ7803386.1 glycine--tRNA ligase subunit beta [Thiohalophilus sp.]
MSPSITKTSDFRKEGHRDLLVEIGTEELPPKALLALSAAFEEWVRYGLQESRLGNPEIQQYASPRRLALLVKGLPESTPDRTIERTGPPATTAFDEEGALTKAGEGFARKWGASAEDLQTNDEGKVVVQHYEAGLSAESLIPDIVRNALDKLPIPKRMRWGDLDAWFVRPVHWVVLLFGDEVIEAEILSVTSGRETRGHRFHHPDTIYIPAPAEYEVLLENEGKVIADFERRRTAVRAQIEQAASQHKAHAVIDEALLDEVTAMVEWPVAITGRFDERFLDVPQEALISTMKTNQKYFHLVDDNGQLLPLFITISNIESKQPEQVQKGNERVIRPRFADAEFFWQQDRQTSLAQRLDSLKSVVFQQKLGTLYDKTRRVEKLAGVIAEQLGGDKQLAIRAAQLCKCDLMTEMVGEFPELQGIMGRYYAGLDGEQPPIARALDDYYKPRFAGDDLPDDVISQSLALADRLDTLLGIFAIGQIPTGDKDPFALRRAALGVLRILIEQQLDLDLQALLEQSAAGFDPSLKADEAVEAVIGFILERLKAYYRDQGIRADVLDAVTANRPTRPLDIEQRLKAVDHFRQLEAADSLSAANKRIGNILKKVEGSLPQNIDASLLQDPAEQTLHDRLTGLQQQVNEQVQQANYQQALSQLADLREPVDQFFDDVMVMAEDDKLRNNRVALLNNLHQLFMQIADISRLQG